MEALSTKVRMVLSGTEDSFGALSATMPCELLALPDGTRQMSASAANQEDVDQIVDLVRKHHLSLHRLDRTTLTLEEVFLSAVNTEDGLEAAPQASFSAESIDYSVAASKEK